MHKQLMKCRYVTKGKELLSQLKTGDIIKSAKLVSGLDRFVAPTESG
jgi:RNA polymerase-interacting CarD/CdnL/TRCF family regulator